MTKTIFFHEIVFTWKLTHYPLIFKISYPIRLTYFGFLGNRVMLVAPWDNKQAAMGTGGINQNIYHEIYSYKILWNIIKFYAEITSNFKVTLKSPAEENRVKICYSSQVWNIFFDQIMITLLAKKDMGATIKSDS